MARLKVVVGLVLLASAVKLAAQLPQITGYFQPRWEATLGDGSLENSFLLRRAYFGVKGGVTEHIGYKVLFTCAKPSVSLFDAYLSISPIEYLNLRLGQFQTPIGMDKLTSGSVTPLLERPYVTGFVIDRDLGVLVAAGVKFVGVQLGVFNGQGRNVVDVNEPKDIAARLVLNPLDFLHLGGAYQMGKYTDQVLVDTVLTDTLLDFNRWGVELALTPGPFRLAGEFMGGADDTVSAMLYYVEADWMLKLDCQCLYAVQPAVRYEMRDPDTDTDGDAETGFAAGVNLHFLPKHKLKLGVSYMLLMEETNPVDNDRIIVQFQWKI